MGVDGSTAPLFAGINRVMDVMADLCFDTGGVKVGLKSGVPLMFARSGRPVNSHFLQEEDVGFIFSNRSE